MDSTAVTIAGMISTHSVQTAPAALSKSVAALAIAKNAAASGPTLTLIKGALKTMAWTKTKTSIVAAAIVILTAGTATTVVVEHSNRSSRQIGAALLAFHHDWLTNNYHPTKTPLPKILTEQGEVSASSAGILGAYVKYDFQKDGIEWEKRYHILRADTNTTTWILYEFAEPKDTNLSRMSWQRKLASVTGEP